MKRTATEAIELLSERLQEQLRAKKLHLSLPDDIHFDMPSDSHVATVNVVRALEHYATEVNHHIEALQLPSIRSQHHERSIRELEAVVTNLGAVQKAIALRDTPMAVLSSIRALLASPFHQSRTNKGYTNERLMEVILALFFNTIPTTFHPINDPYPLEDNIKVEQFLAQVNEKMDQRSPCHYFAEWQRTNNEQLKREILVIQQLRDVMRTQQATPAKVIAALLQLNLTLQRTMLGDIQTKNGCMTESLVRFLFRSIFVTSNNVTVKFSDEDEMPTNSPVIAMSSGSIPAAGADCQIMPKLDHLPLAPTLAWTYTFHRHLAPGVNVVKAVHDGKLYVRKRLPIIDSAEHSRYINAREVRTHWLAYESGLNIVKIYGFMAEDHTAEEDQETTYCFNLFMTYCPSTLYDFPTPLYYLIGDKIATEEFYRPYLRDLIVAVASCHRNGIYHSDIKPMNVFMEVYTGRHKARLGDFGVSSTHTVSGLCGTSGYQAPEMFQDDQLTWFPADMWAFGVTMFELLHFEKPWDLRFFIDMSKVKDSPPQYHEDLSVHARGLISQCLQIDPKLRITAEQAVDHPFFSRIDAILFDAKRYPST